MSLFALKEEGMENQKVDLEWKGVNPLSKAVQTFIDDRDAIKDEQYQEDLLCTSVTPSSMRRQFLTTQNDAHEDNNDADSTQRELKIRTATPSVIRKGLCMVRNESKF